MRVGPYRQSKSLQDLIRDKHVLLKKENDLVRGRRLKIG